MSSSPPTGVLLLVFKCPGAICDAGMEKGFQRHDFEMLGGGINAVASGHPKLAGLGAEIVSTVILVYPVLSTIDAKRNVRDSHVSILAPLSIEFAMLLVHPATIPITGTGINLARSLGAAIIYNKGNAWNDMWISWVGPFIGVTLATLQPRVSCRMFGVVDSKSSLHLCTNYAWPPLATCHIPFLLFGFENSFLNPFL